MLEILNAFAGYGGTDVVGQEFWPTTGVYYWTVPEGVTEISAAGIGAGGGGSAIEDYYAQRSGSAGGGGAFAWIANCPVTPGEILTIGVGKAGISGGAVSASNRYGTAGGNGGNTSIMRGSTALLIAGGGRGGERRTSSIYTSRTLGGTVLVGAGYPGGTGGGGSGGSSNLAGGGGAGSPFKTGGAGYGTTNGQPTAYNAETASNGGTRGGPTSTAGGGTSPIPDGNIVSGNSGSDASLGYFGRGASAVAVNGTHGAALGGMIRIIWGKGRSYPTTRTPNE